MTNNHCKHHNNCHGSGRRMEAVLCGGEGSAGFSLIPPNCSCYSYPFIVCFRPRRFPTLISRVLVSGHAHVPIYCPPPPPSPLYRMYPTAPYCFLPRPFFVTCFVPAAQRGTDKAPRPHRYCSAQRDDRGYPRKTSPRIIMKRGVVCIARSEFYSSRSRGFPLISGGLLNASLRAPATRPPSLSYCPHVRALPRRP